MKCINSAGRDCYKQMYLNLSKSYIDATMKIDELTKQLALSNHEKLTNDLTGLPNRKALYDYLDQGTEEEECYFGMFDIDNFKSFNDTYGHHIGDQVLIEFGLILSRLDNSYNKFFHISGDEFFMVCRGANKLMADGIVQMIRDRLSKVQIPGVPESLGVSCGLFLSKSGEKYERDELLKLCDINMYIDKGKRRNKEMT